MSPETSKPIVPDRPPPKPGPAFVAIWTNYRPLWIGTILGTVCMVFFLLVGNPSGWDRAERVYVYSTQSVGGHAAVVGDYASVPYAMPAFGLLFGLMVLLWQKARCSRA